MLFTAEQCGVSVLMRSLAPLIFHGKTHLIGGAYCANHVGKAEECTGGSSQVLPLGVISSVEERKMYF